MADSVNISQRAVSVDKAPIFEPYSRVIIHAGLSSDGETEVIYTAGNDTGRTLEVSNEWGSQAMANNILARIKGYQYQPLMAEGALVDPSVELGDGITVNGIYSGIFVQATTFNRLMASDISAPVDEEIEHEYGFESQTNRAFTRMVAQTRTGITQNEKEIQLTAEELRRDVLDETNPESLKSQLTLTASTLSAAITKETKDREGAIETLNSEFTQTANAISASVTAETKRAQEAEDTKLDHTNTAQSFGWELTSTNFLLKNNNQTVFQFDKNGLAFLSGGSKVFTVDRSNGLYVKGNGEFSGTIKANAGDIGGITIAQNALYTNGKTGIDTAVNGLHISASGVSLGNGKFKVTNAGKLTATDAELTGKITATSGYIGTAASGFVIGSNYIRNGKTSLSDTTNEGIYIGTDGISLGKGTFKVTKAGAVTASNLTLTGGSINIGNRFKVSSTGYLTADFTGGSITLGKDTSGNPIFQVTSGGAVTAKSLNLTGGSINLSDAFKVTSAGAVTASNLTLTGGSISLGNGAFRVDSNGNVYATSGTFGGNVYAKNIQYGGTAGTMSGAGISAGTIGGQYGGGQIASYTLGDGNVARDSYGYGAFSSAALNSPVQTSLGYANFSNKVFNNQDEAAYIKCNNIAMRGQLLTSGKVTGGYIQGVLQQLVGDNYVAVGNHSHILTEKSDGTVEVGYADYSRKNSFNIANTQKYKDGVAAVALKSLTRTYPDGESTYPYYYSYQYGHVIEAKIIGTLSNGNSGYDHMLIPAGNAVDAGYNSGYSDGKSDGAAGVYLYSYRATSQPYDYYGDKAINVKIVLSNGAENDVIIVF